MEFFAGKPGFLRNVVVRFLLFSLLIVGIRFAYVITLRGESCLAGDDFCFFPSPENQNLVTAAGGGGGRSSVTLNPTTESSPEFHKRVMFYITVFQDLIVDGFLNTRSKSLVIENPNREEVYALKEIGLDDVLGVAHYKKGGLSKFGYEDNVFDFVYLGNGMMDKSERLGELSDDIRRVLKPEGSRKIDAFDKDIHEIVMKKEFDSKIREKTDNGGGGGKCLVPGYKQELLKKAEGLIEVEPLKPWITLKRNIENVKYLTAMADVSFKRRYVYVDVGARSYGSSIVSWFKKQYPKQNKTFDIYAIEADKHFHDQYKAKKGVTLLPYAAWVKNESLVFEINQTPGDENVDKGRGMGRIQPVKSGGGIVGSTDVIQGFDFANWLKNTVTDQDFVVMKMDVEGTEFDLIPKLIETGAICLIDEVFLECHYNRWQKCCPGVRSPKYQKTYGQCLNLFKSLRQRGVLVHQWW